MSGELPDGMPLSPSAATGRTAMHGAGESAGWAHLAEPWPDPEALGEVPGLAVSWPSSSPFAPEHIGAGPEADPATPALGRLYMPRGRHKPRSVPAIVMMHGSGGVLPARELTY